MSETNEEAVLLEHVTKTYPGEERSLRGTKLEWKGPALWLRNLLGLARLTSNTAPPVQALCDFYGWGIERARRNGTLTRWQ